MVADVSLMHLLKNFKCDILDSFFIPMGFSLIFLEGNLGNILEQTLHPNCLKCPRQRVLPQDDVDD